MDWRIAACASALCCACTPFEDDGVADASGSAALDEAGTACDVDAAFGEPTLVPGLVDIMASSVAGVRLSRDSLTAYFYARGRPDSMGYGDLYTAERDTSDGSFGAIFPVVGSGINTPEDEFDPTVSGDGLTLIFGRTVPLTNPVDLFYATRGTATIPFTGVTLLPMMSGLAATYVQSPFIRDDGQILYYAFASDAVSPGTETDIYRSTLNGAVLGPPASVVEVNSTFSEVAPVVSYDDLTIYFASDRTDPGAQGDFDVWTATRDTADAGFSAPTVVSEVNSPALDLPTFITRDGCQLYLSSNRNNTLSAWVATKPSR